MTNRTLMPCTLVLALTSLASAGVLLDYGQDAAASNDFGVVRGAGNPNATFGFDQFQIFNIDAADEAWSIDRVTVSLRLFNMLSTGEATLAIFAANGLQPDLLEQRSDALAFEVGGVIAEQVSLNLGGLVLEAGTYYVGIQATEPTTDLLWIAGDDQAFRTARRSDGGFFTGSPRALSLSIEGAIVPATGTLAPLAAGLVAFRRRRA